MDRAIQRIVLFMQQYIKILENWKTDMTKGYKGVILEWIKTGVIAIILSFIIKATVVEAYLVPSSSMVPTIQIGDRILGNKFIYWFTDPKPGDIVVFRPPPEAHTNVPRYVKRVVAVEGDLVEIKNGLLYVNGKPRKEDYIKEPPEYTFGPKRVPKGHLFVLGDNRNNSHDGHVWEFLPKENLLAKVFFRFWPPSRIGVL
jgi:signal peptidase I